MLNPIANHAVNSPNLPSGGSCNGCIFLAEKTTKQGHIRRLCRLTGIKSPQCGMDGCVRQEAAQGLTGGNADGKVSFPNYRGHIKRPALAQQGAKDLTATAYQTRSNRRGLAILAGLQRPYVREAAAAIDRPGSVVNPAFSFNPKTIEV